MPAAELSVHCHEGADYSEDIRRENRIGAELIRVHYQPRPELNTWYEKAVGSYVLYDSISHLFKKPEATPKVLEKNKQLLTEV